MSTHELKIETRWFERVAAGEKRAEIREHDRDYQVGDLLHLYEVNEWGNRRKHFVERDERGRFVQRWVGNNPIVAAVTHVLPAHMAAGIADGYCLLSIEVLAVPGADS